MRQIIILLALLVLAVAVYAQPACDVDGDLQPGEECDPGTLVYPANDSACPGMCQQDCTCSKDTNYVLFDLAMGHNLLFSKVQDLLHVIKDMLFQLEMKTIEIQLTNFNCSQQPVSFWIPASIDPYGKLNEIFQMDRLLIYSLDKNLGAFGNPDTTGAQDRLDDAQECMSFTPPNYREAFECMCLAYRVYLLGLSDTSVACTVTLCQPG